MGQREAAITDYDEAIRLNPANASAYNNRGNSKAELGQREAAITDYDEAIRLNPANATAYFNRGIIWLQREEWDKARADFHDAKNRGMDIIATFRKEYKSITEFEKQYSVEVPEDIKAILEP